MTNNAEQPSSRANRPSVTFTILILFGLAIILIGAVVTLAGLGPASSFSMKFKDMEVTTSNCGLAMMSIGALLSGFTATHLPQSVQVFSLEKPTPMERLQTKAPQLIILGIGCAILVIVAMVLQR